MSCFTLISSASAWAQATEQANAGQLLEQQRRLEQAQRSAQPGVPSKIFSRPSLESSQAKPGPNPDSVHVVVREFRFGGNTLLGTAELQAVVKSWLGRSVGLDDLRQATATVAQHYRKHGWLAQVTLPAQDITEGVVLISVVEAKVGRIQLRDARADRPLEGKLNDSLQSLLAASMPAERPLNLFALERALLIADEIPGVSVNGSLASSDLPGSTDVLILKLPDPHRFQFELNADNAGNRSTGAERLNLQLTANSLGQRGEQLSLFASTTSGSQYLRLSASWPLTLPLGTGWRMGVNASALRYRVLDAMNITTGRSPEGTGQTYGLDLQYPLVRTPVSTWSLSLGYESKHLRNEDDNEILNVLTVTNRTRTPALTLGLYGHRFDRWAGGGVNTASLFYSNGTLNLNGSPEGYLENDRQTARTQGNFQKWRWSASRLQALDHGFSLLVSGSGQFADQNLDPSEKFYLGGMNGVRAYPSGEAGGSTGQLLGAELRKQLQLRLELSAFYDWGEVEFYHHNLRPDGLAPLAANNHTALQGAGLSLGWRGKQGVQFKATWARRIGTNPLMTPTGADTDGSHLVNRFWFNAGISF